MHILYIVPYVPNPIRVRPYNLIRSLTARGHRLTVMTLRTNEAEDVEKLEGLCHQVHAYPLPTWRSFYNALAALPSHTPLQAVYCWQPVLADRSSEFVRNGNENAPVDIIHVEHLRAARYGLYLKDYLSRSDLRLPIVWDSVDCITHLFDQAAGLSHNRFSRWLTRFERGRTRRYERFLVEQFARVLVTSRVDRQALLSLARPGKPLPDISVLPNGVDFAFFTPGINVEREAATLVVSGKMSYHANVTMVLHLVNEIMPLVWDRKPAVKLWVVGKDPAKEIKDLALNPAVTVTGTVGDLRPYLQAATVAVAPIKYGAGIQNKILEAMACETPVISTSQSISALDVQPGRDLLVADQPADFAEKVLNLLGDRDGQRRMGAAARRYVERHHNWDHIAAQLERIYAETIRDVKDLFDPAQLPG